ncbi:hypothetical protein Acr_13g0014100 [Actinidia rufa]|uniref:HXXXD-type acyl-transferase family protein n=1 Tax=Actinidia rufa TaxID=165716 RepID=A0A7J0FMY6_9ERIC|nr:hypothetical protein Acr_13g0014100 [Actinidia rufa]
MPKNPPTLKNSLSECLTKFYPLAGRVVNNRFVDCSDVGVPYVEAQAHCHLSEVVANPIPKEFNKFLPCDLDDIRDLPVLVQVTFFECGGVAVAVNLSHKVADAMSLLTFVNGWAATARGETNVPPPQFEGAEFFPPIDTTGFRSNTGIVKDNIVTKRFVFTASNIAALRDKFSDTTFGEFPRHPSRIEALSSFIWARFVTAIKAQGRAQQDLLSASHEKRNTKTEWRLCHQTSGRPDFGWGKPLRAGSASLTFKNLVVFMDAPSGGGIEAWVNLKKEDMEKFEMDNELLGFVSTSPNEK